MFCIFFRVSSQHVACPRILVALMLCLDVCVGGHGAVAQSRDGELRIVDELGLIRGVGMVDSVGEVEVEVAHPEALQGIAIAQLEGFDELHPTRIEGSSAYFKEVGPGRWKLRIPREELVAVVLHRKQ